MKIDMSCRRDGFSMVEVLMALFVLSVGILAIAATTGHVFTRLHDAGRRTERAFAIQQAVERVRAIPFSQVGTSMGTSVVGDFTVTTELTTATTQVARVRVVTIGPGFRAGVGQVADLADTTFVVVSRGGQ
jgi:type IV pilus assembly protein PilV